MIEYRSRVDRTVYRVYRRVFTMAYPYSFIKMTFGGDLTDTDEVWSCGFHIGKESSNTTQADLESLSLFTTSGINTVLQSFYTSAQARTPQKMRLQWIKFAAIGTNGRYLGAPVEYYYPSAVNGSTNAPFIPSTASAITLVADKFKDPGKYNRFYLPVIAPTSNGAFKETKTETENKALQVKGLIEGINIVLMAELLGLRIRVVSQKAGIYRDIDRVRVGDVIDTQRRRRNALREEYAEESVTF